MSTKDYVAFISNGNELALSCIEEVVELEVHDQVIQANECNCTHKEHLGSCEIENVVVEVETKKKTLKKYIVEMAFCKECAAYYIPQKSYEFLSDQGSVTHHVKGGVRLFEYLKHGEAFEEEKAELRKIETSLQSEYNHLPKPVSRYAIDDGCGGLHDVQSEKYSARRIYEKQDEINDKMQQPYVGRIDVSDSGDDKKIYYIGRTDDRRVGDIYVYSRWSEQGRLFGRTAEPDGTLNGSRKQVDLRRKIDIESGILRGVEDVFASNSEFADKGIYDKFLIQVLMSRKKSHQLTDIIATIQDKQNEIIEKAYVANMIVQGCAGSGKTMVMLHRLSFWLYNNKSLQPEKIKILTPNENFNVHIGGLHSQLNLGAIEIMSIDQYYSHLLDQYDKDFSYHKKIDEEENIEERFLNYVYSKPFTKKMRSLYPIEIEKYFMEDEVDFVDECAKKYDIKMKYRDQMSDGEKASILYNTIATLTGKASSTVSAMGRSEEKIAAKREKIVKCQETVDKASDEVLRFEQNYQREIVVILEKIITDNQNQNQAFSSELKTIREEIDRLSRGLRRLLSGDAIKKNQEQAEKLAIQVEESNKIINIWMKVRESVQTADNFEEIIELISSRKVTKEKNGVAEYIGNYRRQKSIIFEQNSSISKLQYEIEEDENKRNSENMILTNEEYEQLVALQKKYSKTLALEIFNKIFNQTISEKLVELDVQRSDKTYRYELYARVLFAEMFWNKVVGDEEIICVDEGQDVSYCEYERIIEQNKKSGTYYNVYGDLNQRIKKGRGLVTWEQLKTKLIAHEFELNENYRNTNQITQYCNEVFGFDMTLTGVEGEPVRNITFKEMLDELVLVSGDEDRTAIILPRSMAKTRVTRSKIVEGVKGNFSTKFDTSKVSVMYVDEIKGIEFDRVYVIDEDMERNERYIAFTRALDKLTIVHTEK